MEVIKTIKLEMTEEEKKAIKTVCGMLYDLTWDEEKVVADELGCDDLILLRTELTSLYELGGGDVRDLK